MRVISEPGQGGKENFLGNFSRPAALPPDAVPGSSRGQGGSAMARKSKPDKKPDRRPAKNTDLVPKDYEQFLGELKDRIRTAQLRAAVSVNRELVLLYWQIGRDILARQKQHGWGAKVIEQLKEREERLWYAQETVKNGWSRNVLVHWIESDLYERQGKASTNFEQSMPRRQSDLARELLKDPYDFQFLATAREAEEREIEQGLVAHIREFLLELGAGFAFLGQQFRLEVGGEDFFIDLLFYHVKLRCYVVLELKAGPFKPQYAGKMNFYLSAVDDLLRHPDDKPSIGIILCKAK